MGVQAQDKWHTRSESVLQSECPKSEKSREKLFKKREKNDMCLIVDFKKKQLNTDNIRCFRSWDRVLCLREAMGKDAQTRSKPRKWLLKT